MINESNMSKPRYELEDDPKGGKRIRAISKSRRNAFARELREKERRERDHKKREEDAQERSQQREERHEREPWEGRRRVAALERAFNMHEKNGSSSLC